MILLRVASQTNKITIFQLMGTIAFLFILVK